MNMPSYQAGDRVWIRPEWDGDATLHEIVEWNGDRGLIAPVHWPHRQVRLQELVTAAMIEAVVFVLPKIRKSRIAWPQENKPERKPQDA